MRPSLALVVTLTAACCRPVYVTPLQTPPELLDAVVARTVRVATICGATTGAGTGVVLWADQGEGVVATAFHVLRKGCRVEVAGFPTRVLRTDPKHDVALLAAPIPVQQPPLRIADPALGASVVHAGFSLQLETGHTGLQVTQGHVIAQYAWKSRISASFWFGSSGGGVFDLQGRLLGLAVSVQLIPGTQVPLDAGYLMVQGGWIRRLLDEESESERGKSERSESKWGESTLGKSESGESSYRPGGFGGAAPTDGPRSERSDTGVPDSVPGAPAWNSHRAGWPRCAGVLPALYPGYEHLRPDGRRPYRSRGGSGLEREKVMDNDGLGWDLAFFLLLALGVQLAMTVLRGI